MSVRIGTVDLPERLERERYFGEMSYLELSALFAGPWNQASLAKWRAAAPPRALGLVAPWVVAQSDPPASTRLWHADGTVGAFRDTVHGRSALAMFREAATAVSACHAVFKSPGLHPPSIANRDQLRHFFSEVATEAAVGAARVWIPAGQWEPRVAVHFATELGVTCAIDPLVHDPTNPAEVYEDLEAPSLYFRIGGLGRSGPITSEKLEDLQALVEHYAGIELTIAFASAARWRDARNFKQLTEAAAP